MEPRLLTVEQAGLYLGLGPWFARRLAWERKIAHLRVGRRILFDLTDLDAFIEEKKVKPERR